MDLVRVVPASVRGGTTRLDGDHVVFKSDTDWTRGAGFAYIVRDRKGRLATATVQIRLTGQNLKPTFVATSVTLPAGATRELQLEKLIIDPDTKKPTRVGYRTETVERDGRERTVRVRVAKRSGKDV